MIAKQFPFDFLLKLLNNDGNRQICAVVEHILN
jgi:hypothetical protein